MVCCSFSFLLSSQNPSTWGKICCEYHWQILLNNSIEPLRIHKHNTTVYTTNAAERIISCFHFVSATAIYHRFLQVTVHHLNALHFYHSCHLGMKLRSSYCTYVFFFLSQSERLLYSITKIKGTQIVDPEALFPAPPLFDTTSSKERKKRFKKTCTQQKLPVSLYNTNISERRLSALRLDCTTTNYISSIRNYEYSLRITNYQ